MKEKTANSFAQTLLRWNREQNTRQMPWKGEKDPYKIWLSEIILQQTRVEQGWDYYNRFVKTFPTVQQLAAAADEKVFKLWEGLGYYSRCRNLLASARYISKERKGVFPSTYDDIKSLKGVGPYTAAAIASFAYNLPHAVVDGNVYRVLARVFGIDTPSDSTAGKKEFTALAEELLDKKQPGLYNQAIMDFGAVVCKPAAPLCTSCPFKKTCIAYTTQRVNELPIKGKKLLIKKRWFNYLVIQYKDAVLIHQRMAKDIWQGLYDFTLIETDKELASKQILQQAEKAGLLSAGRYKQEGEAVRLKQLLSHQQIHAQFIPVQCSRKPRIEDGYVLVPLAQLKQYAFPRVVNEWLGKVV